LFREESEMNIVTQTIALADKPTGPGLALPFLAWLILVLVCFVNCSRNKEISNVSRGVWLLVIFLIPIFGALGYLIGGRHGDRRNKPEPVGAGQPD
jgi:hypothetical protein